MKLDELSQLVTTALLSRELMALAFSLLQRVAVDISDPVRASESTTCIHREVTERHALRIGRENPKENATQRTCY